MVSGDPVKGPFDPQRDRDPQVENGGCSGSRLWRDGSLVRGTRGRDGRMPHLSPCVRKLPADMAQGTAALVGPRGWGLDTGPAAAVTTLSGDGLTALTDRTAQTGRPSHGLQDSSR